jgi:hypothetical protein
MRPHLLDPRWTLAWVPAVGGGLRAFLRAASHHTGLPVVVVGAVALVLSWRLLKRTFRLAVEVAVAVVLLVAATRLGWLKW